MRNRKYKTAVVILVAGIITTTGCGLTVTTNYYYGDIGQTECSSAMPQQETQQPFDTLTTTLNASY